MIRCRDNYGQLVELPKTRFKPRPSVYAVFVREGKVLVCRTRSTGRLWLPGGGVECGEMHEQALRREVREEAGIEDMWVGRLLMDFQHYCYYAPTDEAADAHLYFYLCSTAETRLKPNELIEDGEAIDFRWLGWEQLRREEFCDVDAELHGLLEKLRTDPV